MSNLVCGFAAGMFLGGFSTLAGELIATSNELGKFFAPASQAVGIIGGGAAFVHFLGNSSFDQAMKIGAIASTLFLSGYESYRCVKKDLDLAAKEKLLPRCVAWFSIGTIVAIVAKMAVGSTTAIVLGGTLVYLFPFQYVK